MAGPTVWTYDGWDYLSTAGLRSLGWTTGLIKDHLGEPDLVTQNPTLPTAPPMRLYSSERAIDVMNTDAWKQGQAAAVKRSEASRKAAATNARRKAENDPFANDRKHCHP